MDKPHQVPEEEAKSDFTARRNEILLIKCESIVPNPSRPFKRYPSDELRRIAGSFLRRGIGIPATVLRENRLGEEKYLLLAGEKIFRAALIAGIERIPCDVLTEEDLPHSPPSCTERHEKVLIRDQRLFFNSITHSVDLMRQSGIDVSFVKEASDEQTVLTITVPKSPPI